MGFTYPCSPIPYKILNNIDKVQYEQILPLSQTTTRGHSKKLYKKNVGNILLESNRLADNQYFQGANCTIIGKIWI